MSVKFQDTITQTTSGVAGQAANAIGDGKHPVAKEIGTALTGGAASVGQKGYLAVSNPTAIMEVYKLIFVFAGLP